MGFLLAEIELLELRAQRSVVETLNGGHICTLGVGAGGGLKDVKGFRECRANVQSIGNFTYKNFSKEAQVLKQRSRHFNTVGYACQLHRSGPLGFPIAGVVTCIRMLYS